MVTATNVTIAWQAETNVHYRLQVTLDLTNTPSLIWSNVGPVVIGLANSQSESNAMWPESYYRVVAPQVWP